MYRPEDYHVLPKSRRRPTAKKLKLIFFILLIVAGGLAFLTPIGVILLIVLPFFSLGSYQDWLPIKSSEGLHSWVFLACFLVGLIVLINRDKELAFMSKPFVEGTYEKEIRASYSDGDYYEYEKLKFHPKSKKEKNIVYTLQIILFAVIIGSVILSYRVHKWYEDKNA